jgi:hypothetical protein
VVTTTHLLHLGLLMRLFAIYSGWFPPSSVFAQENAWTQATDASSGGSRNLLSLFSRLTCLAACLGCSRVCIW